MVYGPGRYRFRDFARVGAPLTLLLYLIAIALVPRFWPVRQIGSAKVFTARTASGTLERDG